MYQNSKLIFKDDTVRVEFPSKHLRIEMACIGTTTNKNSVESDAKKWPTMEDSKISCKIHILILRWRRRGINCLFVPHQTIYIIHHFSSNLLSHSQQMRHLGWKISHEIFVKIENAEYLSSQLRYANFDLVMMFPIENRTFEQFFIFWISKMYHVCQRATVNFFKSNV